MLNRKKWAKVKKQVNFKQNIILNVHNNIYTKEVIFILNWLINVNSNKKYFGNFEMGKNLLRLHFNVYSITSYYL